MKELNPLMVYEDQFNIKKDLHSLDTIILPNCPKIQREFEGLGIGEISNYYLNDILYNSCSEIERELNQENVAVKKLKKVTNILLDKCKSNHVQDLLRYLSISENGNIVFSVQSKEKLKERYRQYVQTPTGISRRQLHEKAVKALNEFKKAMGGGDVLEYFDIDANDDIFPIPVIYE